MVAIEQSASTAIEGAKRSLTSLLDHASRLHALPRVEIEAAAGALEDLAAAKRATSALCSGLIPETEALASIVRPRLEAGSETIGWAAVAELAERPEEVAAALKTHALQAAATTRLRRAAAQVDEGVRTVLDQRLLRMGEEIARWWGLLRPDELTAFDAIVRRGAGRKYLDVTATLAPQPASAGVVRNALAVLSNSQLNALGLAAFLARCQLLLTPLIVLDDPVPASDREHRSTFASNVVGALLDGGQQVIVATHDSELARHLQSNHQHLGVDEFQAAIVDPRTGTQVLRTGDEFERLMLDASSQMHSPLHVNRRAAGNSLRIATERLAKHVIVAGRRRAGETSATLSDYDNKNLRDLRPLVVQYVIQPNEPGRWQMLARTLNDADHDTLDPPQSMDLKQCHATLRDLKKQHTQNDALLMRS